MTSLPVHTVTYRYYPALVEPYTRQHTHSTRHLVLRFQHASKVFKLNSRNRLGHHYSFHLLRRAVLQHHLAVFHSFTHNAIAYPDMIGPLVERWVLGQRNRTLIVLYTLTALSLFISPSWHRNALSQIASWAASVSAIYSASVDDNATVRCFLLRQLIYPLFIMKAYPLVLRRVFI